MITVDEARALIQKEARNPRESRPAPVETVTLDAGRGRVLAEDIRADRDYPPFNRSAMDGFALAAADFNAAPNDPMPVVQEIFAGRTGAPLKTGQCARIMTGAPVPEGADTVIRVEDSESLEGGMVRFSLESVVAGRSVAQKGEDAREGDILLEHGEIVTPMNAGTLATAGRHEFKVYIPPTAAILSTGDEIVSVSQEPLPHQIRDSNHHSLFHFLSARGIQAEVREIVPDDPELLRQAVTRGLRADVLILTGGVSMGDADFVPDVLGDLGVTKIFHKVHVKPGKPIWFGRARDGRAVFGLPGNPLSCQVGFKIFVEPYLRVCMGLPPTEPMLLPIQVERRIKDGREEFFPCRLTTMDGRTVITPVRHQGSGDIKAAARSHGLARQEAGRGRIAPGELVQYYPWT